MANEADKKDTIAAVADENAANPNPANQSPAIEPDMDAIAKVAKKMMVGMNTKQILQALTKGPADVFAAQTRAAIKQPTLITQLDNHSKDIVETISSKNQTAAASVQTIYGELAAETKKINDEQTKILTEVEKIIQKSIQSPEGSRIPRNLVDELFKYRERAIALARQKASLENRYIDFNKKTINVYSEFMTEKVKNKHAEIVEKRRPT